MDSEIFAALDRRSCDSAAPGAAELVAGPLNDAALLLPPVADPAAFA
jgi:hypothetical protein